MAHTSASVSTNAPASDDQKALPLTGTRSKTEAWWGSEDVCQVARLGLEHRRRCLHFLMESDGGGRCSLRFGKTMDFAGCSTGWAKLRGSIMSGVFSAIKSILHARITSAVIYHIPPDLLDEEMFLELHKSICCKKCFCLQKSKWSRQLFLKKTDLYFWMNCI